MKQRWDELSDWLIAVCVICACPMKPSLLLFHRGNLWMGLRDEEL
jgi:hypothetical protein